MNITISSGHGKLVRGASGYLDEVNEARKVVEQVAAELRHIGIGVLTFHDDTSTSQNQNLKTIVAYHNSTNRELDVSVHFNAYQTTSKAMGTECLYVTQQSLASKVSSAMASAGRFTNRGAKKRTDLYFLNNTNKPAILLEVCFVDSSTDANLYREHFVSICKAIVEAVSGQQVPAEPPPVQPPTPPDTEENRVDLIGEVRGDIAIYVNGELLTGNAESENVLDLDLFKSGDVVVAINGEEFHNWPATENPNPEEPEDIPSIPANQTNIICTVFGGSKDPNNSAYQPYDKITDTELGVALPFKFTGERRKVRVINRSNRQEAVCSIRDLGPWLTDDPYWDGDKRPLAETCYKNSQPLPRGPNKGKIPNGAGIDITPGAAKKIGLSGKGNVDWEFV